jgi:hypothetical protein
MPTPYGLEMIEDCLTCKLRADRMFCDLSAEALAAFDAITYAKFYLWRARNRAECMWFAAVV